MPTYVYQCSSCNNTFEVEQRITAEPLNTCECGSVGSVKRVIQRVAVSFKGAGFHINDYAASGSDPKSTEASATETKDAPKVEPTATPALEVAATSTTSPTENS